MLASRFWIVALSLCLGAAVFVLFVAERLYNRTGERAMSEALFADSSAVGWYLKDDARTRSSALIPIALNRDMRESLNKASDQEEPSNEVRDNARVALKKLAEEVPDDLKFTYLWAVDANGRVIANVGFDHGKDWELGGFAVVADALHGWIRDDAWVWKEQIYRVVARPVELNVGGAPVGAVVGATIVDAKFASSVSRRTGAAVGFYADGVRVASHAPEGFDKANLDGITADLKEVELDDDYQEIGRTKVRVIGDRLGVVYARMPGEAWDLGAGYAVGRLPRSVDSPLTFVDKMDEGDKDAIPTLYLGLATLAAIIIGLFLTIMEHTKPLATFRKEALKMAKGEIDVLAPSKFRGVYKKIASDLNDGIEKIAVKGGVPRRAADLEEVLGPIPAQPAMSAFSVPGAEEADSGQRPAIPQAAPPSSGGARLQASIPKAKPLPKPSGRGAPAPVPSSEDSSAGPVSSGPPVSADDTPDELTEWQGVYQEFLQLKKQCGEQTASLTFEKFKGTLERNKNALVARHNCSRVKFTVYIKEGKAALKASPVK